MSIEDDFNEIMSQCASAESVAAFNRVYSHTRSVERQRDDHFSEIVRARGILEGLTLYREKLVCFISRTTSDQRDRIKELATQDCDYDRSVLELLDDFRRLSVLAASEAFSTPVIPSVPDKTSPP